MNNKKILYLLSGFGLVLIVIIVGIIYSAINTKPAEVPIASTSPTPIPTTIVNPGVPPVSYKSDSTDRLIDKVKKHPVLSVTDFSAKQKILSFLPPGKTSGPIFQTSSSRIEYLKSPDTFLVEILIKEVAKAKAEPVTWFQSQGMSKQGICNLTLSCTLNFNVQNEFRRSNLFFSHLPEVC